LARQSNCFALAGCTREAQIGLTPRTAMNEPIQFSDTEKYLIAYYRAPSVSTWWRTLTTDGAYLAASLVFVGLHFTGEDVALGMIGYGILFYRIAWGIWQSRRWLPAMQNIVAKYESRVAALTAELEKKQQ
jgi:hypothetical protein